MVNITVVATYLISNMVYCELDSRGGGIRINSDLSIAGLIIIILIVAELIAQLLYGEEEE